MIRYFLFVLIINSVDNFIIAGVLNKSIQLRSNKSVLFNNTKTSNFVFTFKSDPVTIKFINVVKTTSF